VFARFCCFACLVTSTHIHGLRVQIIKSILKLTQTIGILLNVELFLELGLPLRPTLLEKTEVTTTRLLKQLLVEIL